MIATFLLNFLLATVGLTVIVTPLAAYTLRELAPASQPRRPFVLVAGGWR
jgi:hypothetical protein